MIFHGKIHILARCLTFRARMRTFLALFARRNSAHAPKKETRALKYAQFVRIGTKYEVNWPPIAAQLLHGRRASLRCYLGPVMTSIWCPILPNWGFFYEKSYLALLFLCARGENGGHGERRTECSNQRAQSRIEIRISAPLIMRDVASLSARLFRPRAIKKNSPQTKN